MSDTPITDAFLRTDDVRLDDSCKRNSLDWSVIPTPKENKLIDFARQLERELAEANNRTLWLFREGLDEHWMDTTLKLPDDEIITDDAALAYIDAAMPDIALMKSYLDTAQEESRP